MFSTCYLCYAHVVIICVFMRLTHVLEYRFILLTIMLPFRGSGSNRDHDTISLK